MPKGMGPKGKRYWTGTGKSSSVKGKKTPDRVGAGRAVTDSSSGGGSKKASVSGGGTGHRISGVRYHSGTEDRKSDPSARHGKKLSIPSGKAGKRPSGVREHKGTSAPKSAKDF